ncbi:MAG: hypothetical protein FWF81_01265 [Defluviitaleaceae bacterium]|nr:hypothetical protein [Defluviitaleaceae bacterium]
MNPYMTQTEWNEIRDKVLSLPALENRMNLLSKIVREAENAVFDLRRAYGKEAADVTRLEESTFTGFLLKILGKYENRLEKEQQEEIHAKLEYDKATIHWENLKNDHRELSGRINEIKREKIAYDLEIHRRRTELAACTSDDGQKYAEIEKEHESLVSEITQIAETLRITSRIISTANAAISSLESAEDWATLDVFTKGGILTHALKYSNVDDAEQHIHTLSSLLRELKGSTTLNLDGLSEISSGQRAVDLWFDNIFTNLSIRGKIIDNASKVKDVLQKTKQLHSQLDSKLSKSKTALASNRRREESFIAERF